VHYEGCQRTLSSSCIVHRELLGSSSRTMTYASSLASIVVLIPVARERFSPMLYIMMIVEIVFVCSNIQQRRGSHGDVIISSSGVCAVIKIQRSRQLCSFPSTPKFDTKKPVHSSSSQRSHFQQFPVPQCPTPPPPLSPRTACLRLRKKRLTRPQASKYASR
jgi:hypothetical protein